MAAKPETTFSNAIRKALPEGIYSMKNNNQFIAGVPDLWISGPKADIWIEMKFVPKLPVKVPLRIGSELLSALQLEWLKTQRDFGRKVFVIVGTKIGREYGGIIFTDKSWEVDLPAQSLSPLIKSKSELVHWITEQVM